MSDRNLDRMAELTARYADYGNRRAGLVGVWGGFLMVLVSGLATAWGLHLRLFQRGGAAFLEQVLHYQGGKVPVGISLLAWAAPFLFLAGSAFLRKRIYQGFGVVKPKEPSPAQLFRPWLYWTGFGAVAGVLILGLCLGWFQGQEEMPLRLLGMWVIGAAFVMMMRLRKPREDEMLFSMLLYLMAGMSTAMPSGMWLLLSWFFLVLGIVLVPRSAFQHRDFLKLRREIEALGPEDAHV